MLQTVLIIEDDEDTRAIYAEALRSAGYQVLTARQGAEGVHLARTRRPSLVLLDIRMPIMDGWDALRYLRAYRETHGVPICLISAYAPAPEELERVRAMGIDCFLMKPVDPREVVAAVQERIGAPGEDAPREGTPPRRPSPTEAPSEDASHEGSATPDAPDLE